MWCLENEKKVVAKWGSASPPSNRTKGNCLRLQQGLDIREKIFTERVIEHWPSLPRPMVQLPFLQASRPQVNVVLFCKV